MDVGQTVRLPPAAPASRRRLWSEILCPDSIPVVKKSKKSYSDWSALPDDLLNSIADRLPFDSDIVRLRAVCTSWRSALPRRRSPWLASQRKGCSLELSTLSGDRILTTPEGQLPMPCCGSSHGWLALIDTPASRIVLFNPLTRRRKPLPPINDFLGLCNVKSKSCFHDMVWYLGLKLVLSSSPDRGSDCTAALVSGLERVLATCRPGRSREWALTYIPGCQEYQSDPLFYKGSLYIATGFYVAEFYTSLDGKAVASSRKLRCFNIPRSFISIHCFLVESGEDLLLISRGFDSADRDMVEAHRIEFSDGGLRMAKLKKSLGDRALFVGLNHGFSVSAKEFDGCEGNRVYVADDERYHKTDEAKELRVFDLADGYETEQLSDDHASSSVSSTPCAWMRPCIV